MEGDSFDEYMWQVAVTFNCCVCVPAVLVCVAVNFWYDMEYDVKYNYFKFVEKLKLAAAGSDIGGSDIGGSDIGGSDIDGSESSQE